MEKTKKKNYSLTYPKIVALGFGALIALGTLLLMLPQSSKIGGASFMDALFTATSATCITGLVPYDTFSSWSLLGQIIIICLIQIGGLGFITILSLLNHIFKRDVSLKQKMLLKESVGSINLGDVKRLSRSVVVFTALCELSGALLLMTRYIPLAGVRRGIYMSLFTSVSAFCNAGFDLMGMVSPSSSLTTVYNDPVILITIMLLIVFGGLGFFVWEDMHTKGFKPKAFSVHTKLVLATTSILIFGGALLFFALEYNASLKDMSLWEKIINAFFCSITPRTAGFNSVDMAAMTDNGKLATILLMFVGGSTGSTAGGVKTTTVAVLVLCAFANMRNKQDIELFGKRLDFSVVKNSISICAINFSNIVLAIFVIGFSQKEFALLDVVFECTSAMGTVGITTGITPSLNNLSMLAIIVLMYVGRLTSMIFALSFVTTKAVVTTKKPLGKIMVG